MHRIDGAGHVDHMFVAEDPATLRPPTEITPEILNAVQEELATFIEWAGVVLAKGDNTQLRQALVAKFAGLDVAVTKANLQAGAHNTAAAGGTADAITAAYAPAIAVLTNGMTLYVRSALTNETVTPTFTPNNGVIPTKTIVKGAGAALVVGDIAGAGHWIALQYDLTLDKWVLLNPATGVTSAGSIPQNSQSAAYILQLSDAGKHILHPSADVTARTFTIPANATVAFPIGTAVTFVNQNGAGAVTIAITADTMRLAGAGSIGNRTLAANGIATALKISATEWIISGTGLS